MSTPTHPVLQGISHLDVSSPSYPHQLNKVLHGAEYLQCAERLGTNDQRWLVEYLDEVRHYSPFSTPTQTIAGSRPHRDFLSGIQKMFT